MITKILSILLNIRMKQYIKFGQNASFGSRDRVNTSFFSHNLTFKLLMWLWKCDQGHQTVIISFLCLSGVPVQVWLKSTNWFRRQSADRAHFTVFIVWWPWKLGQGHQIIINSFNSLNDTIHIVWLESIILFQRQDADKLFLCQTLTFKVLVWPWR